MKGLFTKHSGINQLIPQITLGICPDISPYSRKYLTKCQIWSFFPPENVIINLYGRLAKPVALN